MFSNLSAYDVVLASNSPRRKELLKRLGLHFRVSTLFGVDERYPDTLPPSEVALYIAKKKAEAYRDVMGKNVLLITADTTVVDGDKILGKPADADDAKAMLRGLSGKSHHVTTGVCVQTHERTEAFSVTSEVKFGVLTDNEINYYVDNYLPFDKAGAYGIQEWIGLVAVEELHGSFFNVMGLPVQRLYKVLSAF